jgi:hypothetical protein
MTNGVGPQVLAVEGGKPIQSWTAGVPFEREAQVQVERIARLPFIHRHVAVMPDVHLGSQGLNRERRVGVGRRVYAGRKKITGT